jgi:hypothetical protein
VYLLGSITCRMFRSCSEGLVIVGWIRLIFTKQGLFKYIYIYIYVACCLFQRSDPVLMQSALYSRYRGGGNEPTTARTNLYTCLCTQEFDMSHLPDQVQDQVARLATSSQVVRQITGPLTKGPGPTSRPGSLPAPRVACHCPPVGFGRQHILARPVGPSSSTSSSLSSSTSSSPSSSTSSSPIDCVNRGR